MTRLTDEAFEALSSQYSGRVERIDTPLGTVVLRAPKRLERKRYLSQIFDEKRRQDAAEILARTLVVHPDPKIFSEWLEEYPGIPERCIVPMNRLAGAEEMEEEKK